jgi:hypothetical protein
LKEKEKIYPKKSVKNPGNFTEGKNPPKFCYTGAHLPYSSTRVKSKPTHTTLFMNKGNRDENIG